MKFVYFLYFFLIVVEIKCQDEKIGPNAENDGLTDRPIGESTNVPLSQLEQLFQSFKRVFEFLLAVLIFRPNS